MARHYIFYYFFLLGVTASNVVDGYFFSSSAAVDETGEVVTNSNEDSSSYGVDCSFPIHRKEFRCGNQLGDRQKVYDDFMDSCREAFSGDRCDANENDRLAMSLRQPQSMVNYTSTGFKKIKAPAPLFKLIRDHWDRNQNKKVQENWGKGNIYTNNWQSPTYMVNVEDTGLRGGGRALKNAIWDAAKSTIEQWTQMELRPTSMYGIRAYTDGSILSPHVDRLPLVSSCIINVDQDVDEDWPLEVYDRQGNAVNVTMEPGDMVLYESGSLIHGRPFPLKGRYYANIFIHFEPTGRPLHIPVDYNEEEDSYDDFLPPYILPHSPEVSNWSYRNPTGWKKASPSAAFVDTSAAHRAAAFNDMETLAELAKSNSHALFAKDKNGWQPIHEAARGGHLDVIEFLVKRGADVNARTHQETGVSPLAVAVNAHSIEHPVSQYLLSVGAVDTAAEL